MKKITRAVADNYGYIIIFAVALAIRLHGIGYGLPDQLNGDETHLVSRAVKFGSGDFNPHFFFYPAFHMYLLFAFYGAAYVTGSALGVFSSAADFGIRFFTDPTLFYMIARVLSALMGAATVVATGLFAEKYYGRRTGTLAAVFMCFVVAHSASSHFATTDVPMTFWMALALLAAPGPASTARLSRFIFSGALAGVAVATKYSAALIAPSLLLLWILHEKEIRNWEDAKSAGIAGPVAMFIAMAAAFFICAPYTLLDFGTFKMDALIQKKLLDNGWLGLENIRPMWIEIPAVMMKEAMGAPLWIASAAGMIYALFRRRGADLPLLLFAIVFYMVHARSSQVFARYMIMATPVMCVFAASVTDRAASLIKSEGWFRTFVSAVFACGIVVVSFNSILADNFTFAAKDTRTAAREWIEKNIAPGSKIAVEFGGPQLHPSPESLMDYGRAARYAPLHIDSVTPFFAYKDRKPIKEEVESKKTFHLSALEQIKSKYDTFTSFSLAEYPLDMYRSEGYRYIVVNSGMYDRYFAAEKEYPAAVWFYRRLELECALIKEFKESKKMAGPTIKIYKVLKKAPGNSVLKMIEAPQR